MPVLTSAPLRGVVASVFVLGSTLTTVVLAQGTAPEAAPSPDASSEAPASPTASDASPDPEQSSPDSATTAEQAAPPPLPDPQLAEAKELFRKGNAMRKVGDFQRAYEYFRQSRELAPSLPNTLNAALALHELGRFDEALELYEAAFRDFAVEEKLEASLEPRIRELRSKVGSVQVTANVDGMVVIDGRPRGQLPLRLPLRCLPGARRLRIVKDGYVTHEQEVTVTAGQMIDVDAQLQPLANAGRLRVELADEATGALVAVDGVVVGEVPWEGTLAPGEHVYSVTQGNQGTGPLAITVLQGQTVLARPPLQRLGPEVRFLVEPVGSTLMLDGMTIENGFSTRLTQGTHELIATQEGYRTVQRALAVGEADGGDVAVKLEVDPNHPRWAQPEKPRLFGEIVLGPLLSSHFGGDATACDGAVTFSDGTTGDRCDPSISVGGIAGIRGGYRVAGDFSVEPIVGYAVLTQSVERDLVAGAEDGVSGWDSTDYEDRFLIHGPFAAAGASYRFFDQHPLTVRLQVGAWLTFLKAQGSGSFSASVRRDDGSESVDVAENVTVIEERPTRWLPFLGPEVRWGTRLSKRTELSLGVAGFVVLATSVPRTDAAFGTEGRRFHTVDDRDDAFSDGSAARPGVLELPRESTLGVFWTVLPTVGVRYDL